MKKDSYILNIQLFILTVISTLFVGANLWVFGNNVDLDLYLSRPGFVLIHGLPFTLSLMGMLLFHEFGHYFMAKRYGVDATLPYFIPFPNLFGTLGAVIRLKGRIKSKKALFDIGVAGPLAGLVVAIPVLIFGLSLSEVKQIPESAFRTEGNSILYFVIKNWMFGQIPKGYDVFISPMAFAGWIGCFVTALNLLPVGQLDGGHVIYAIFGDRSKIIAKSFFWVLMVLSVILLMLGYLIGVTWFMMWLMIKFIIKVEHPPVENEEVELDPFRKKLGFFVIFLFIILFVPIPIDDSFSWSPLLNWVFNIS